ncbi:PD-(D/E)XK nuclease family transposase [Mediterraneibacter faecis]|uniref:PD-(D/E)XK nuclease family transposase n=1 Tax=Mediterraneibacter faecis TaxID=592978 RepID=UPI003CF23D53
MFCNTKIGKEYTDLMEMHILELSKLPPEEKNETSLLQWMRFLGRKTRKDFEEMAKKNSELEEAYDVLDKLSADEKKRLEYETRQRAIRDYNIGMLTAERRGIEAGRKIGMEEGREKGRTEGVNRINQLNIELSKLGRTEDILKAAVDKEYQEKLLKEFEL